MKLWNCPKPACREKPAVIRKHGFYITRFNAQPVRRFRCLRCGRYFSTHTFRRTYRQKRPDVNDLVFRLYTSSVTQRRMASLLKINRKTVVRKLRFLANVARDLHQAKLDSGALKASSIQYDEMESFEHTRLKPLSIGLAVNPETYEILVLNVAPFPAKGKLALTSRMKYGVRPDLRPQARKALFQILQTLEPDTLTTDFHPAYPSLARRFLPHVTHLQTQRVKQKRNFFHKNRRRNLNDHLFALNFICAKIRHDLSRMARKVWVTTKKPERLKDHLDLYIAFQNNYSLAA